MDLFILQIILGFETWEFSGVTNNMNISLLHSMRRTWDNKYIDNYVGQHATGIALEKEELTRDYIISWKMKS